MALLHLHTSGDPSGKPLLAIHGITAHGRRFDQLCSEYLADRYVVAPDLRGHGRSLGDAPWNLETHVADIVETLDHLGWASVDVIGHSLGGNLALRLLSAHANRVERLVLLDPAFALPSDFCTSASKGALVDKAFDSVDAMVSADHLNRPSEALAGSEADIRLVAEQGGDSQWRMPYFRAAVVAMWAELAREVPPISERRPTMLINALKAELVLQNQLDYLEANLGDQLERHDVDLGHMVYWEDLVQTGELVANFLR